MGFWESIPLTAADYWNLLTHSFTVAVIIFTAFWLDSFRIKIGNDHAMDSLVARARRERDSKEHKVLSSPDTVSIKPFASAEETRNLVLAKKLDAKENIAFLAKRCRRYATNKKGVNAIAEELYDEAYKAAGSLDVVSVKKSWFQDSPDKSPPLFCVPISVKECVAVEGCYSTGGLACRLTKRVETDGLIVELLRKAGALPLCTGNVVQLLMLSECNNRIWGRSRNPWDLSRTPGGSSGGDAALVAMGCVPLAVCSDVAGSIRIPASFCGVVGFKPTPTRLSGKGNMKPRKDDKAGTGIAIPVAVGPIARTVEDCSLFMKAVITPDLFAGDLNVPPLLFDDKAYRDTSKLKIGYFKTDAWFEPCATSKRALNETISALEKAGHTCVPFEPPTDGWSNYELLVGINSAEGNFKSFMEGLEGEDIILEYTTLVRASNVPNWLRWILCRVLDKRRAHLLGSSRSGGISVFELWKKTADLLALRQTWSDAFKKAEIDAVVYPGFPVPAFLHRTSADLTAAHSYMFLPNLLLWPAGVVPVTTVKEDEQHYRMEDIPANQRDIQAKLTASLMEGSAGLPISVSVMTPAFQDEKCLRVMKEIESLVNFNEKPAAFER